jgi:membrane fusion protein, heavy metal efflux system
MKSVAQKTIFQPKHGLIAVSAIAVAAFFFWGLKWLSPFAPTGKSSGHVSKGRHGDAHDENHEEGLVRLSPEKQKAAGLKLAQVERGAVTAEHWLTGQVNLDESRLAHINSRVTGTVREVHVSLGQEVKADQTLAVLDSIQVGNAKLELYEKALELDAAKVDFDWNNTIYTNTQQLVEALEEEKSPDAIDQEFKGRAVGDYRQQLLTAYTRMLLAIDNHRRLTDLQKKGITAEKDLIAATAEKESSSASYRALLEQIRFSSKQAFLKSQQAVRKAETAHTVAREQLHILGSAHYEPESTEIGNGFEAHESALYPIKAPFDGIVIEKHIVLSEQVTPERAEVFTVADLSTVWVKVDVYEKDFSLLPALRNSQIQILAESYPDRTFEGQVFYTGDVIDESTRTIRLIARARNSERLLKPGLFVRVGVLGAERTNVCQAPASAVFSHEKKSFVFVPGDHADEFVRRDVVVGAKIGNQLEIISGLEPGEQVVVEGGFALKTEMLRETIGEE